MYSIDHIVSILKSFDIESKPLDKTVDSYFRRHREVASRERRAISDAVFGIMRARRRIEAHLRGLGKNPVDRRMAAEVYLKGDEIDRKGLTDAEYYSYPDFLFEMFEKAYGREGAQILAGKMNSPSDTILRVNTLKSSRDEVARMLAEENIEFVISSFSPYGLRLLKRANLNSTAAYKTGCIEVQDEASQLAVIAADPRPGENILDACAGAGGKSLMMAMLMKNEGRILAADPNLKKLSELKKRAGRAGASTINTIHTSDLLKRGDLRGSFDLVFVDAPCSGTGTLRRNPDLKWRISPERIKELTEKQRELIVKYAEFVRPGGRLVYATCSILPCENEEVVEVFLNGGNFRAADVTNSLQKYGIPCEHIVTKAGNLQLNSQFIDLDGFFASTMILLAV